SFIRVFRVFSWLIPMDPNQTPPTLPRRSFLAGTTAVVASAAAVKSASAANEKINVGFIGYGLIGKRHVLDFQQQPDVNIVAVAECHEGRLNEAKSLIGGKVRGYRDFRELLDAKDIDAVVISTPDHWHALMTVLACAAGKDVYVEKPLTLFVREGEWMLQAATRHGRVVQVGPQQRSRRHYKRRGRLSRVGTQRASGRHYQRCVELIRAGHIGEVRSVRMAAYRNIMPGF